MSRLLQFFDGQAKRAVVGFEGVPGGLSKTLKMLEQRFGQPHIVAKGCVDALVDGESNILSSDRQGLREFADRSRTLYKTLQSMNALSEMNIPIWRTCLEGYQLHFRLSGETKLSVSERKEGAQVSKS